MEKRHLSEREMQHKALGEFDDLERLATLVDWDAFILQLEKNFGCLIAAVTSLRSHCRYLRTVLRSIPSLRPISLIGSPSDLSS